jgi:hypothetical protein
MGCSQRPATGEKEFKPTPHIQDITEMRCEVASTAVSGLLPALCECTWCNVHTNTTCCVCALLCFAGLPATMSPGSPCPSGETRCS